MRYDRIIRWTAGSQLRRFRRGLCDFFTAVRAMAAAVLECAIAFFVLLLTPILGPLTFGLAHRRNWNNRGQLIRKARRAAWDGPIGYHPLGRDRKFWRWAFPNSRLYRIIDRAHSHGKNMMKRRLQADRERFAAYETHEPRVTTGVLRTEADTERD